MRVQFSIGVGDGDQDRDQLEQYRSGARAVAPGADIPGRPPGWPAPTERSEDDADPDHAVWAW